MWDGFGGVHLGGGGDCANLVLVEDVAGYLSGSGSSMNRMHTGERRWLGSGNLGIAADLAGLGF